MWPAAVFFLEVSRSLRHCFPTLDLIACIHYLYGRLEIIAVAVYILYVPYVDCMFSGHFVMASVVIDTLLAYTKTLSQYPAKAGWSIIAKIITAALMVASRSHYTIDIMMASLVYELVARVYNKKPKPGS